MATDSDSTLTSSSSDSEEDQVAGSGWSDQLDHEVIYRLKLAINHQSQTPYKVQLSTVNWDKVKFAAFTADQCKERVSYILSRMRNIKTLGELATEGMKWKQHKISGFDSYDQRDESYS